MSEFAVPDSAVAALESAMEADGIVDGGQPGQVFNTPDNGFDPGNTGLSQGETATPADAATQPAQDAAPVAPEQTPVAPDATPAAEDSFAERFDPNSLPPELQPAYKLMQADYTRKRQADAEAIRLAEQYQGIDLDAAVQLFEGIRDPDGLIRFVQEASEHLAAQGLVEFDDPAAPVGTPTPSADQNNLTQALDALAQGDPELAPLAEAVKSMQARIDSFESSQEERVAAEREQTEFYQALGEVQRAENVIRTDNPHYDQDDIDSIYEIASHYDGDLLAAQARYEASFARRLGRYMQSKESTPDNAAPTGLPQPVQTPELSYDPLDPKQAHAAALETLRLIESQPG